MRDFIKKTAISFAFIVVFGFAFTITSGCNCEKGDEEEDEVTTTQTVTETTQATTEATTEAQPVFSTGSVPAPISSKSTRLSLLHMPRIAMMFFI